MGQKTNPNILRAGKTFNWKSKYFEKKTTELAPYIKNDLEIKNFIFKYFKDNGFTIYECKLHHLNESLHVLLSYYNNFNAIYHIDNINKNQEIKFIKNKNYNKSIFKINSLKCNNKKVYSIKSLKNLKNNQNTNNIFKKTKKKFKIKRTKNLIFYKKIKITEHYNTLNNKNMYSFLESFLESLTQFTDRKLNIFLILNQLNKNIKQIIKTKSFKNLKKYFVQFRKYNQNKFFKEGINTLFTALTNKESAYFISDFITQQLKQTKRHNFFLKFIKTVLTLFINTTFSYTKGIKIIVKGRINGTPRARHRIINIGNSMPLLTINSHINYSETVSFTPNGTIGVKVWTSKN